MITRDSICAKIGLYGGNFSLAYLGNLMLFEKNCEPGDVLVYYDEEKNVIVTEVGYLAIDDDDVLWFKGDKGQDNYYSELLGNFDKVPKGFKSSGIVSIDESGHVTNTICVVLQEGNNCSVTEEDVAEAQKVVYDLVICQLREDMLKANKKFTEFCEKVRK